MGSYEEIDGVIVGRVAGQRHALNSEVRQLYGADDSAQPWRNCFQFFKPGRAADESQQPSAVLERIAPSYLRFLPRNACAVALPIPLVPPKDVFPSNHR